MYGLIKLFGFLERIFLILLDKSLFCWGVYFVEVSIFFNIFLISSLSFSSSVFSDWTILEEDIGFDGLISSLSVFLGWLLFLDDLGSLIPRIGEEELRFDWLISSNSNALRYSYS